MRGVVTLAAVFAAARGHPAARGPGARRLRRHGRHAAAARVLTLPWLARRLGVHGPDPREDALQEATVLQAAVSAGLRRPRPSAPTRSTPQTMDALRQRVEHAGQHRVGAAGQHATRRRRRRARPYRRLRLQMLAAERAEVLRIRDAGRGRPRGARPGDGRPRRRGVDARPGRATRPRRPREGPLLPPEPPGGACDHLRDAPHARASPLTPRGLPGLRARGHHAGAPAVVPDLRQRRLLRLLGRQARRPALRRRPGTR